MFETYENLKELATLYTGPQSNEEAALAYQQNEDAEIFAYVFTKNFGMIYSQSNKYFNLSEQDKASYALQELHNAMIDYRIDKGAKFATFFSRYLNRRLYAETKMLNHHKRKANVNADDYMQSAVITMGEREHGYSDTEFLDLIETGDFTEKEKRYCKLFMQETAHLPKDSEVASKLGISSAGVKYIRDSLKKKFSTFMPAF